MSDVGFVDMLGYPLFEGMDVVTRTADAGMPRYGKVDKFREASNANGRLIREVRISGGNCSRAIWKSPFAVLAVGVILGEIK